MPTLITSRQARRQCPISNSYQTALNFIKWSPTHLTINHEAQHPWQNGFVTGRKIGRVVPTRKAQRRMKVSIEYSMIIYLSNWRYTEKPKLWHPRRGCAFSNHPLMQIGSTLVVSVEKENGMIIQDQLKKRGDLYMLNCVGYPWGRALSWHIVSHHHHKRRRITHQSPQLSDVEWAARSRECSSTGGGFHSDFEGRQRKDAMHLSSTCEISTSKGNNRSKLDRHLSYIDLDQRLVSTLRGGCTLPYGPKGWHGNMSLQTTRPFYLLSEEG